MQSTRTCYGRAVVEARSASYQNLANFLEARFTIIYIVSNNYCASTDTDRRNQYVCDRRYLNLVRLIG
jgi:hypothetical protein